MAKVHQHRPELRAKVREYLDLVPAGRRATLPMIVDGVNALLRIDQRKASDREIQSVLGWLIDRTEVEVRTSEETEQQEYRLR